MKHTPLTPELMLRAYASGIFPMAEGRDDPRLFWVDPPLRGILPLDGFHISRSLRRRILRAPFRISFDAAFGQVVRGCADREETWINPTILDLCERLHTLGHAHSVEVWDGMALVGGSYGVALGGAFFAESMFSRRTDASKIALAYLVDRLRAGGFALMDTQFLTGHLASLGGIEISRTDYHQRLGDALDLRADFHWQGPVPRPQDVVQRNTQISKRA
jgi:leucyl/phenylalanyl-tRNA--protein transferase